MDGPQAAARKPTAARPQNADLNRDIGVAAELMYVTHLRCDLPMGTCSLSNGTVVSVEFVSRPGRMLADLVAHTGERIALLALEPGSDYVGQCIEDEWQGVEPMIDECGCVFSGHPPTLLPFD
jgi:hypothetical protein